MSALFGRSYVLRPPSPIVIFPEELSEKDGIFAARAITSCIILVFLVLIYTTTDVVVFVVARYCCQSHFYFSLIVISLVD